MHTAASGFWKDRGAGVLAHITSLPSAFGIGELGHEAHNFIDWLSAAGFRYWQVLPMGPNGCGNSPYASWSAFCGNPLLISLDWLARVGLLNSKTWTIPSFNPTRVDFEAVKAFKEPMLTEAAKTFLNNPKHHLHDSYQKFKAHTEQWLPNAALFLALETKYKGDHWWQWEPDLRNFEARAVAAARKRLQPQMEIEMAKQFFFSVQLQELREHAFHKGVKLIGDVPIYVDLSSADVWSNQPLFKLGDDRQPTSVAGVPPDDFSPTGQLWGNPIYNWSNLVETGFDWWLKRIARAAEMTDAVRIDHFRGLSAYWEVPRGIPDARAGRWEPGPGHDLLKTLTTKLPHIPMLAEDLGVIDAPVEKLRDDFALPGMLVLQFAFDEKVNNPYLPHNHSRDRVVYSGTHDNDTTLGWWRSLDGNTRDRVVTYMGLPKSDTDFLWMMQRTAMGSVANTAILSMQDVLELGSEARMNQPGTAHSGNWSWRFEWKDVPMELAQRYRRVLGRFNRAR
jgi:4-alpha-glucanotransferase